MRTTKSKTSLQVYKQQNRIYKLQAENLRARLLAAHPDTGGSAHLAHNWGNDEAQRLLNQNREREWKLFRMFGDAFNKAFKNEYPHHLTSK